MTLTLLHFAEDGDTSGFFPQLARWHDRQRFRMIFGTLKPMTPRLREYMTEQGVECFSCECTGRRSYPGGMWRLARFLRRQRVDILHTHLFEPTVIGLWAGMLAGTRIRLHTRHCSDYHTRIGKTWHVRLEQLATRLSHAVIANSHHTAVHLISIEGAPRQKVRTVLYGIDFDRVKLSSPDAANRIRDQLGIGQSHLLLTVARLHPEKGYEYLIRALPEIRARVTSPFRLVIAGTGPFAESYQEQVKAVGCSDVVQFLGFRRDVPDLMAAADLLILPSVAEAFGLVLTEALYLGTPVVATQVGGIPEVVRDGVDGVLVPPADSPALAVAISELLNDEPRRQQLAGAGCERIHRDFRVEDMVRSYEAVYEQLICRGGNE